jgi:hypothetical protein
MDWQFKIGLGVAFFFGLLPYAVKDMPHWVTWSGMAIGLALVIWGIIPSHERLPLGPVGLAIIGIACLVGACGWYSDISKNSEATNAEAIAQLTALGWTVRPFPDGTRFEIANGPPPSMERSKLYFARMTKPFSLSFQMVPNIDGLHKLASIKHCTKITIMASNLNDLSELRGFTHLINLEIAQVPYSGGGALDVSPLGSLVNLESLDLRMTRTRSIEALATLTKLKTLSIQDTLVSDISALSHLTSLEALDMRGTAVTGLRPIADDAHLAKLTIGAAQLAGLPELAKLSALKSLIIIEQSPINISSIRSLTNLESLDIWYLGIAPLDISSISNLNHLQTLRITGGGGPLLAPTPVNGTQIIGDLTEMRTLGLSYLQIADISFVARLRKLEAIGLNSLPITSISALNGITTIKDVTLSGVQVVDISPLLTLPNLGDLAIGATPARADVISQLERRGVKVRMW